MLPRVLVDTQPVHDLLTRAGEAVWPVVDDLDSKALHEAAEICGVEIRFKSGRLGTVLPENDSEVVAIGEEAESAGRLYAHLTRRRYRSIPTPERFDPSRRESVLVLHSRHLHSDLLDRLYPPPEGVPAPGLICASTPEELRRQALARAVSAFSGQLPRHHRIDLLPFLSFDVKERFQWIMAGKNASTEDVRKLLSCGAGILSIRTHSDGVDAMLGPSLVLCPLNQQPEDSSNDRKPRCLLTRYCHRSAMTIDNAWVAGRLISPGEICARIFLLDVCRGLLQPDAAVDPIWGQSLSLLRNYKIGAIVTTWDTSYGTGKETGRLARMIAAGLPLGEALSRHLNSTPLRLRTRLCLLGDPRMRLPESTFWTTDQREDQPRAVPPARRSRKATLPEGVGEYHGELELARQAILGIRLALDETMNESAGRALGQVTSYLQAQQGESGLTTDAGTNMRAALLEYLLYRGPSFQSDWISLAEELRVEPNGVCPFCGRRTFILIARLDAIGADNRRLSSCPRCGRLEDVPVTSDLKLGLTAPMMLTLRGTLPKDCWCAGVALCSSLPAESTSLMWPMDRTGKPQRVCEIREALPIGPFTVLVILLAHESFHLLSVFTSASALS